MKTQTITLEKGKDGRVWARCESMPIYSEGANEEEAKQNFKEAVDFFITTLIEDGEPLPDWYDKEMEFTYNYDLQYFFEAFPFINATAFGEAVGINGTLMRNYKNGHAQASEKQKKKIQKGFEAVLSKLAAVTF